MLAPCEGGRAGRIGAYGQSWLRTCRKTWLRAPRWIWERPSHGASGLRTSPKPWQRTAWQNSLPFWRYSRCPVVSGINASFKIRDVLVCPYVVRATSVLNLGIHSRFYSSPNPLDGWLAALGKSSMASLQILTDCSSMTTKCWIKSDQYANKIGYRCIVCPYGCHCLVVTWPALSYHESWFFVLTTQQNSVGDC